MSRKGEKRSHQLHVLVTEREKQQIYGSAQRFDGKVSRFVRQSCLFWGLYNPFDLLIKLGQIVNLLEKLAQKYEDPDIISALDQFKQFKATIYRNFYQ